MSYCMIESQQGVLQAFGCKWFILNNKDQMHKFDSKADGGIFIFYLITRHYNI